MNPEKQKELEKKFDELERKAKNPDALAFDVQWRKLVRQYGDKTSKVKQSFVKRMIPLVNREVHWQLWQANASDVSLDPEFVMGQAGIETLVDAVFQYHLFHSGDCNDAERARRINDKGYETQLVYEVAQTILSQINDMGKHAVTSDMSPEIVSCRELCDTSIHQIYIVTKRDKSWPSAGIMEVFYSAFFAAKGVLKLLTAGLGREAFLLWRNVHEQECIVSILLQYGQPALKAFMEQAEFMKVEFDDSIERYKKELGDKFTDENLKDVEHLQTVLECEIKKHGVGKRQYIDYGWLLEIEKFVEWRDVDKAKRGLTFSSLQRFANFPNYDEKRDFYLYACKFTHPTFHAMRLNEYDLYKTCIFALYQSLQNIAHMFQVFCKTHDLFKDDKYKTALEQLYIRLGETYEILKKKHLSAK